MNFEITILGSNSAQPTPKRFSSSHVVNFREKLFLLDCGEGTQIQLRRYNQKFTRLNHIFISHLHGDHFLGLPGLISTMNLMGRKSKLHLYAHADLEKVLQPLLDFVMPMPMFEVVYHPFDPSKNVCIYEDKSIEIFTIPLKHRTPTAGFLLKEKDTPLNIKKEMIDALKLGVKDILRIKNGEDYVDEEGKIIPNSRFTTQKKTSRSYAYITDTAYKPDICPLIENVDVLYHEATFANDETLRVSKTLHSTGEQAGQIALQAKAKRLFIGHFSSRYKDISVVEQAAKEVFENSKAVYDGLTIEI